MTEMITESKQRFEIIDIVRGIALLGVLLANTIDFSFFSALSFEEKESLPFANLHNPILFLTSTFLDGKFYSLFSILFGTGFALFLSKPNCIWLFSRRMFFLIFFGITHALLIWNGDILLLYGLLGFCLPLLTRLKDKTLLFLSIILICSPILIDSMRVMTNYAFDPGRSLLTTAIEKSIKPKAKEDGFRAYANLMKTGNYQDVVNTNSAGFYFRWAYLLETNRPLKVLGLFILGLLIGRNKLFLNLDKKTEHLKRIRNRGLGIGLPASLLIAYFDVYGQGLPHLLNTTLSLLSVIPMALAYLAIICLWCTKDKYRFMLNLFVPFGRMALTCYLMQSVAGILIYRGSGIGLALQVGPAIYIILGLLLFVLQILFCHIWLKYYEFGPFEWIWRQLTYWKRFPLRCLVRVATVKKNNGS